VCLCVCVRARAHARTWMCAWEEEVRVCVRVCVRACVCACARARGCVRVRVSVRARHPIVSRRATSPVVESMDNVNDVQVFLSLTLSLTLSIP
jgi:hypothetical protein